MSLITKLLRERKKIMSETSQEEEYSDMNLEGLVRKQSIGTDEFEKMISNLDVIKFLASMLYRCDEEEIESVSEDNSFNYPQKIRCFDVNFSSGRESKFYIKESWENGLKEAAGMELMNFLTETPINYLLVGENILLTEHIDGTLLNEMVEANQLKKEYTEDDSLKFAIGEAQEYARFLGLGDRHGYNVIYTQNGKVANIDFGFLFRRDGKSYTCAEYTVKGFGYLKLKDEKSILEGREYGKAVLCANLGRNISKIMAIYKGLKEELRIDAPKVLKSYCKKERWDIELQQE